MPSTSPKRKSTAPRPRSRPRSSNLEYCNITSPIDGRAGQRLVDVGNVVNSSGPDGGSELLTIQRIKPIYADFTIPEQDLPRVREHMQKSRAQDAGLAAGRSRQAAARATLTFLDNAVQEGTGTVKLRATLAEQRSHISGRDNSSKCGWCSK